MGLLSTAAEQQAVVGDDVSETHHVLSKEDFLKLMLPDSPSVEEGRRKVSDFCVALKLLETLRKSLKRHQDFQSSPTCGLSRDPTHSSVPGWPFLLLFPQEAE